MIFVAFLNCMLNIYKFIIHNLECFYALWWISVEQYTPFLSPVKGTISSLSLYSMASFSRYLRSFSLSNDPVVFLTVWSFCRIPAGRRAFCSGQGDTLYQPTDQHFDTLVLFNMWNVGNLLCSCFIFSMHHLCNEHIVLLLKTCL